MHDMTGTMQLVATTEATHTAVASGSWFDASTWAGGQIPGANARVIIPAGLDVTYDGTSEASIFSIGVMGALTFSTSTDSKLKVDTIIVDHAAKLTIGTATAPVASGVTVDIEFANNGAIDTTWDPTLVSRGLIALGEVEIHGQEKSSHHKASTDPMAGATSVTLAEVPINWQVGDKIVVAGSHYEGHKWDQSIRDVRHHGSEDEVRTITAINGDTVSFDSPLIHDHDAPRADLKVSIANYTRNVTFSSEEGAAVSERGHVMLHSRDSDVRYAAFDDLGRTDKSVSALAASAFGDDIQPDSNVQGRYSLHFHNNGVDQLDDPAFAVGNAINGSPGWGLVHHNSNVMVVNNATFDTFGAGYVAETGNEIGAWTDNIAINAQGVAFANPKNIVDLATFDMANGGDGFWFQGRLVQAEGNIAASVSHGYVYFHRGPNTDDAAVRGNIYLEDGQFELTEALDGRIRITPDDAPILNFSNNETFAAQRGLIVVKANPNQGHDIHSEFNAFTAWGVQVGAHFEYTSHYLVTDFDVVAKTDTPFSSSFDGIRIGRNASDFVISNAKIDGFNRAGISLSRDWTSPGMTQAEKQFVIIDPSYENLGEGVPEIEGFDPTYDRLLNSAELSPEPLTISLDGPLTYRETYNAPGARIVDLSGVKTDGVGTTPIPAGSDTYHIGRSQVIHILETDGYFSTAAGEKIFFVQHYYRDRLTGEISKFSTPVYIHEDVSLGNRYFSYRDAKDNGLIDLDNPPPVAVGETVEAAFEQDTVIDVLANDADPAGAAVQLDGIVPPKYGQIFDNGDGTVTYRPFDGFTGSEDLKYWVSDGAGNLAAAWLTINVTANMTENPQPTSDMTLTLEAKETGEFGNLYRGNSDADGIITAAFETSGRDLVLEFSAFDIDFANEVEVFVNGTSQGHVAKGVNNLHTDGTVTIAAEDQIDGTNTVSFEVINPSYRWGVTDLLLRQASDVTLSVGTADTGEYGNLYRGHSDADGILATTFEATGTDLQLEFNAYDIDFGNEVEIFLNGVSQGHVAQGQNNRFTQDSLSISAADQIDGTNTVTFEVINPNYRWGVSDLLLREAADVTLTIGSVETGEFGNLFRGQSDEDGILAAAFEGTDTDLELEFSAYDIDFANELEIFLNGVSQGHVAQGQNNRFTQDSLTISAADQIDGTNVVSFEVINPDYRWGVTDLMLFESV